MQVHLAIHINNFKLRIDPNGGWNVVVDGLVVCTAGLDSNRDMAKRRNLKKEKQERNRAYARKFKKRKLRNDGRGEGAGNGVTGTANNGGAAD